MYICYRMDLSSKHIYICIWNTYDYAWISHHNFSSWAFFFPILRVNLFWASWCSTLLNHQIAITIYKCIYTMRHHPSRLPWRRTTSVHEHQKGVSDRMFLVQCFGIILFARNVLFRDRSKCHSNYRWLRELPRPPMADSQPPVLGFLHERRSHKEPHQRSCFRWAGQS